MGVGSFYSFYIFNQSLRIIVKLSSHALATIQSTLETALLDFHY